MPRRYAESDSDWVRQVPDHMYRHGPYEDYGWEAHQSVLLPFRDPSTHLMPYDLEGHERLHPDRDMVSRYGRADMGYQYGQGYMQGGYYDTYRMEQPGKTFTGVGPKGYQRSDQRIYEDVCDWLTRHPHIDASDIEVRVENGEVTLEGNVEDRRDKRLAEEIVEQVRGVRDVHNNLKTGQRLH